MMGSAWRLMNLTPGEDQERGKAKGNPTLFDCRNTLSQASKTPKIYGWNCDRCVGSAQGSGKRVLNEPETT